MAPPLSKMKVLDLTQVIAGPFCCQVLADMVWATGRIPRPLGSAHRLNAPYQALALEEDKRFSTNADRMEHREELEAVLRTRDTDQWVGLFLEAGVPVGPIYNYKQVFEDPQARAREMVVEMEHPVEGTVRGLGIPVKLSETPGEVRRPAPLLGQHTEVTLAELGYSRAEIAELRERNVI